MKRLIKLMDEKEILELEFEEKGFKIKLKRGLISSKEEPIQESFNSSTKEETKKLIELKSEMVGTFYRAFKPGDPPCVDIGDMVSPGDLVGGIEAMKVMNEVKAKVSGKILEILVEDGHPVEYGQKLFLIEAV
ncbi:MAG: biotin/lipoyl-binding protein [bacterium]|nr:biotin/lipoyl-binding protein [bacterium]